LRYPVETFTAEERRALEPHFSNLDRPVFALTNLPETVKGALFARYSRYQGTLRRLYLDEFADSLPESVAAFDGSEGKRAADLYERIFVGYGDDSVAQLGGAHVAAEWCSNVLTKLLQRPRLGDLRDLISRRFDEGAVVSVGRKDTLLTAFQRMRLAEVSQLPVLDGAQVVGVVDESDLLLKVHHDPDRFRATVESAMTTELETVAPGDDLRKLEGVLNRGLVAIVADDERFYGLITRFDLLNHLRRRLG